MGVSLGTGVAAEAAIELAQLTTATAEKRPVVGGWGVISVRLVMSSTPNLGTV